MTSPNKVMYYQDSEALAVDNVSRALGLAVMVWAVFFLGVSHIRPLDTLTTESFSDVEPVTDRA